mmetsp:Transcript_9455/g.22024  ORF Transcript_9455/g.22024 Transcript_9455/m.22024 type:complete len:343 (-) Transcript_9455:110-1138(-)
MSVREEGLLDLEPLQMSVRSARDIGWEDMNQARFALLMPMSLFFVRGTVHPLSLVKTRLQMQRDHVKGALEASGDYKTARYHGTFDAFRKIVRFEGFRGLFKGFAVSSVGIFSGQLYVIIFETIRAKFNHLNGVILPRVPQARFDVMRNAAAGGCASLVSQTIVVPIDLLSQKRMMCRSAPDSAAVHKAPSVFTMASEIARRDGVRGFYKGFSASLCVYAPSSAIWWGSYQHFREGMTRFGRRHGVITSDAGGKMRVLEAAAGASAGIVATIMTNPMDVARTRLQVSGEGTLRGVLGALWREEGKMSLMKGVHARILATVPSSVLMISVYEGVKRLSVIKPE